MKAGTYYYCKNSEESKAVQEFLLKHGIYWASGKRSYHLFCDAYFPALILVGQAYNRPTLVMTYSTNKHFTVPPPIYTNGRGDKWRRGFLPHPHSKVKLEGVIL